MNQDEAPPEKMDKKTEGPSSCSPDNTDALHLEPPFLLIS